MPPILAWWHISSTFLPSIFFLSGRLDFRGSRAHCWVAWTFALVGSGLSCGCVLTLPCFYGLWHGSRLESVFQWVFFPPRSWVLACLAFPAKCPSFLPISRFPPCRLFHRFSGFSRSGGFSRSSGFRQGTSRDPLCGFVHTHVLLPRAHAICCRPSVGQ